MTFSNLTTFAWIIFTQNAFLENYLGVTFKMRHSLYYSYLPKRVKLYTTYLNDLYVAALSTPFILNNE